jgi:hypothetical protein
MQPNTLPELANIINSVDDIVVAIVLSDGCENFTPQLIVDFENKLNNQSTRLHVYKICYVEDTLPFPRPVTPSVYYFAPKNQTPLFYRTHGQILVDLEKDIATAVEMYQNNKSYVDAALDETTKQQYLKTEEMVKNEDISKFPPLFQQMRNLGKEMWATGKNAVRGLPVLADADTAFQRFSMCQSCEFFKDDSRCEKCGCFMKTKTQLAGASCPIGKWGSVT